ncbi:bifunctional class I SAM-dependent methyltransferase/DEAD/DEAH box helicase [Brevundimonas sp.]|uniref:bifunctional class I SAM-dependent methyltransferase/DEAD/DEAH box helicase n=1 Tax=Brevundimonas sp. TaxID=1871086 RepID=UPI002489A560|nr:bifunctional class I SAM-dependent methyltransferase/DEAD/DEAH box helicase [Brevundimonas sp.]MDI1280041.1 bifunctional class I SAM-dependent methyltransferase/DEAD/DEAH box helicase [Brevundimonas sp.]
MSLTPTLSLFDDPATGDAAANILAAARALAAHLARSCPLDRRLVAAVMTTTFGASDAEGAWSWRDAYDAIEAATVLQVRRLAPQVGRLEDAPAEIAALLAAVSALGLTQTRRSEAQVALDQFSTPPHLAALAVLAARVRPGDRILEPSAGTGLLAAVAEACGGHMSLNEIAPGRADLLDGLFPDADRTRHDGRHIHDLSTGAGGFDVVVCNPPFSDLGDHLSAAFKALADHGRLAAIVPLTALEDAGLLRRFGEPGRAVGRIALPPHAFAKHGTSVETGLLVIDRTEGDAAAVPLQRPDDLQDAARRIGALAPRVGARPRTRLPVATAALLGPRARGLALPSGRLAFLAGAAPLAYDVQTWTGEGRDVGLYQAHALGRIILPAPRPHPSPLVESGPMASVAPPAPTYRPVLPPAIRDEGRISDAQTEMVIHAGEAHAAHLPGWWRPDQVPHQMVLVSGDRADAVRLRRGFFLGDGTGCGKGRQIAAVIADNMCQGRVRALWLSRNDALLEDARRDWAAIGGSAHDIVPLSSWKQGDAIRLDRGVLFATYATLRQPARGDRQSRLDQIIAWLGADFDGVIAFDEAHAMANAAGGGKGARGAKKASLQGMAGLALQNRAPDARVLYVSATGATTAENLAYAARLGLWGGPEAPFISRADFLEAMDRGGVAAMELVARELKALGLYVARSLSFEGVEYEPLVHPLTPDDIAVWDAWADAFQLIHANLGEALKAVGVNDDEGKARSGQAASAAHSAFEGAKLRFFGHLLAGLKAPSLVAAIRDDLASDRSAVVQIVSTNEAVMERRLSSIPPEEWNNLSIDLTPREYVLDYLREAFPVHLMEAIEDRDGNVTMVPVMDGGRPAVSQEALARRQVLIERMACLPAVPGVLDALLDAFGTDAVAEITGRSRRVVVRDGRRIVERRGAAAARAETDAFMEGRKRVLIFSDAGGTGRSYHSDLAAANRQRRVHYLVEPGWRADAAIQGLGRSHRTHQASAPLFRPVTTDIQGEKRFTSTIARRLDTLGALTRGERRTAGAGLFRAEDNLESPWARRALLVFYGALAFGELASMTLETFMTRTGLKLLDADGGLKPSDDLPPIHTFLNRLLALRIADQNALFEDFDRILSGILERAAASGDLDRGLEDIEAGELEVLDQETIRTDVSTGAETALVTFSLRVRRDILRSDDALARAADIAHQLVVNAKSGRAAIAELGLTTATDEDRLVAAVRLIRPDGRQTLSEKTFEESAWKPAVIDEWRRVWDEEVAGTDPWLRRELTLATGLLLPIWGRLPARGCSVRRVRAPDGRRWLGRVLDETQARALKASLGLGDIGDAWADGARTAASLLDSRVQLCLDGGLWLKRARVMDRWRIEVVGGRTDRDALVALGCFVEIIAFTPRVFIPVDRPRVLEAVLRRHPVQSVLDGAAA